MALAVVFEVVVEVVGDGGELLHLVVDVFFAAGLALAGGEAVDLAGALVEEGDEGEDALWRVVGGVAEFLDFAFGEGGLALLGASGEWQAGREGAEDHAASGERVERHGQWAKTWVRSSSLIFWSCFKRGFDYGLVLRGDAAEELAEAEAGGVDSHFGVFEALGVSREAHVDVLGEGLDALEGGSGLVDVSGGELFGGYVGVDFEEFGIEEALLAGYCVVGAGLKLGESGGVQGQVAVREGWRSGEGEEEEGGAGEMESHGTPAGEPGCRSLCVVESDEAVSSLKLLIRIVAVRCCEELLVGLLGELYVVELVVRDCCEEQDRGRWWKNFSTQLQCLQGYTGIVVGGGGKG